MLEKLFKSFYLTQNESNVMRKLLELGPQPASAMARIMDIPRNTIRGILDNLVKKGLLTRILRVKTQYYSVETVDRIKSSITRKNELLQQELQSQIELLDTYADEFTQIYNAKSRPKITFYEGTVGIQKVYEDTLTAKNDIKSWGSFDVNKKVMQDYFQTYYKRRAKKKIHMQSIHPDTPLARSHQNNNKLELRTSALVPIKKFNITPEIQIYNGKINIVSWKEKIGIIIESQEIADALEQIFLLSFEVAKKYGTYV